MDRWIWVSASQIGTSHRRSGQQLQDAYSCFTVLPSLREVFVGIVSDGAGSSIFGRQGAALICRTIGLAARRHLSLGHPIPCRDTLESWVDQARDRIYRAAAHRGKEPRDFAATLVCAISDGQHSVFAHVGDGCAVTRERATGEWVAPTWPDHGEYASMTSFVTDQPAAKVRVCTISEEIDAIAIFSDGIERMVLDMATRKPAERFFAAVAAPVTDSPVPNGKDAALSRALAAYLDSEQVCARTDDDKTLVIATLR
ncbi:protein phosphatase 2C domain-containing protein [Burkholderiaceae bacterium FT117]|uniref:PP2C family serine/threonine-protein phosphatase n=1 Tax=Zeimonas sediminis TaxID=2944268 RepID=UPI002342C1A2|nr:PP2C family serine/threonine-protein phosphatase [Zeimonas sediminis]MCM5570050.1 protein phosphatase 2C domain-containing protein [Zeimonas sediminis]